MNFWEATRIRVNQSYFGINSSRSGCDIYELIPNLSKMANEVETIEIIIFDDFVETRL